jgi:hypothetical protein
MRVAVIDRESSVPRAAGRFCFSMTKLKQRGWAHIMRCILLLGPLILSITSVLRIGYQRHVARMAVAPESKYFRQVYSVVSANFADSVSPEKAIYQGAIPGMLRTLDPHSTFFDQDGFRKYSQARSGNYSGIGVELAHQNHQFIVVGSHSNSVGNKWEADQHLGRLSGPRPAIRPGRDRHRCLDRKRR